MAAHEQKRPRAVASERSDVKGVSWHMGKNSWRVRLVNPADRSSGKQSYYGHFSVNAYGSVEAARQAAEERANAVMTGAHTERLTAKMAKHTSNIKGVNWSEPKNYWQVRLKDDLQDKEGKKKSYGTFSVKAHGSIEAARQAAEERANAVMAGTYTEPMTAKVAKYTSRVKGVSW
ncbi:MAG: AP2 domain-containing protein, partial [Exilibacterium sp.]